MTAVMKHAVVTPLLKKSDFDPETLSNYRPISNLSFILKLLEKYVASQIEKYVASQIEKYVASQIEKYVASQIRQAKSLNSFKNRLDKFWSNQEILHNFEAPLKTGTGILKLLIDEEEDLIIEESQESCDQKPS